NAQVRSRMVARHKRLSNWLPVFDPTAMQFTFSRQRARTVFVEDPFWSFRYLQGQQRWRLLHGEDLLAGLPALDDAQRLAGAAMETRQWWTIYANRTLTPDRRDDQIFLNAMCTKAVAEVLGTL